MTRKGEHHDIYFEIKDDKKTKGLWKRIVAVVNLGWFDSPSHLVREAVISLLKKYEKKGRKADKEVKMDPVLDNVKISKVGRRYKVIIENLQENEYIEVGGAFYKRDDSKKVVRHYGVGRMEICREHDQIEIYSK